MQPGVVAAVPGGGVCSSLGGECHGSLWILLAAASLGDVACHGKLGEVPWQGEVPQQGEVSAAGGRCPWQGDVRKPGGDCCGSLVVGEVCRGNHQGVCGSLGEGAAASLGEVLQQGEVSVAPSRGCRISLGVIAVAAWRWAEFAAAAWGCLPRQAWWMLLAAAKTGGGCRGSLEVVAVVAWRWLPWQPVVGCRSKPGG